MSKRKSKTSFFTVGLVVIIAALALFITGFFLSDKKAAVNQPDGNSFGSFLTVNFIDVGQGDSTLITCKDTAILIDAGESGEEQTVIDYLKDKGVTELSLVVATHPHSDHIGGLPGVMESFKICDVLMPEIPENIIPTTSCYKNLLTAVSENAENVISACSGKKLVYGDVTVEVLAPVRDYEELNNMSVVLKLSYGASSVLLTGDAQNESEKDILASGYDVSSDLIKLGHHGSRTSSSEKWLKAVSPEYAVISCGAGNDYGHPHKQILKRLEKLEISYFRTDLSGNLIFISDGNSFKVQK